MGKHKKIWIPIVSVVLVGALVAGIVLMTGKKKKPVDVYSVDNFSYQNFGGGNQMEGVVKTDKLQSVYISATQEVTEVYVQEGQQVSKGDPILAYDTTLTELSLKNKELEVKKLELRQQEAEKQLKTIKAMKPIVYHTTKPTQKPTTKPTQPNNDPYTSSNKNLSGPFEKLNDFGGYKVFWLNTSTQINDDLLGKLYEQAGGDVAKVVVFARENNRNTGEILYLFAMDITKKVEEYEVIKPTEPTEPEPSTEPETDPTDDSSTPTEEPTNPPATEPVKPATEKIRITSYSYALHAAPTVDVDEPDIPDTPSDPGVDVNSGYTSAEIAQMRKEKEAEIADLKFNIRMAQAEYKIMQAEFNDGKVYSELDGIVQSVIDPETAQMENTPLLKISGGGSYLVEGTINEYDLAKLQIGQTVQISDYWGGGMYSGTVIEVKDTPSNNTYYGGNSNVSYYPFVVRVDEAADLQEGYWVSLQMNLGDDNAQTSLFVQKAFIRQENGESFAYVRNEEGKLEKRVITTGVDDGYYLEVLSGLSTEDYVAFPYGKDVVEGAPTNEGDLDTLYGSLY